MEANASSRDSGAVGRQSVTPQTRKALTAILVVGVAVIVAFFSFTWTWIWAKQQHMGLSELAYESSLFVPPVIAFFGLFYLRSNLSDALAGGFMVLYFTVLTTVLAFEPIGNLPTTTDTLRGTIFGSLTTVINVVVAFYFGSGAATQLARLGRREGDNSTAEK